jgi:hypothetical protein
MNSSINLLNSISPLYKRNSIYPVFLLINQLGKKKENTKLGNTVYLLLNFISIYDFN